MKTTLLFLLAAALFVGSLFARPVAYDATLTLAAGMAKFSYQQRYCNALIMLSAVSIVTAFIVQKRKQSVQ